MAEQVQEREETGEHIGEGGATQAMREEVEEEGTQETKGPQR